MPPKDFSQDGAFGAGGGSPGQQTGGTSVSDFGRPASPAASGVDIPPDDTVAAPRKGYAGLSGSYPVFGGAAVLPYSFADGGLVTDSDGDDDGDTPGGDGDQDNQTPDHTDDFQQRINAALETVDNALSYGRKLHGLSGGQQTAAAMPMIPGTQSESGIPPKRPTPPPAKMAAAMPAVPGNPYGQQREQPAPGPLPPTNNPFGKRVASNDVTSDSDATPGEEQEAA